MNNDFSLLLAEMRSDFIAELPERCNYLDDCIVAAEKGEPDAYDELYRQVHSLKGTGGTFGLTALTYVCHQFESFLAEFNHKFDHQTTLFAFSYVKLIGLAGSISENQGSAVATIDKELEHLRRLSLTKPLAVLLVEPSPAIHKICKMVLTHPIIRLITLDRGLAALTTLLHEPFDLLVASRELSDLNAVALVAAIRESNCRNRNIPVILISSNAIPPPAYLGITATIPRDPHLADTLSRYADEILSHNA